MSSGPRAWWEPLIDRGVLPDALLSATIRARVSKKLRYEERGSDSERAERLEAFIAARRTGAVTEHVDAANRQHYEVPTAFYEVVLGPHRKYSSAWWPEGVNDLESAERAMLQQTCEHAQLAPGQRILELGCGWGSLTLWMAEHYPGSEILAISNSTTQREYIEQQVSLRGLRNVTVQTVDVAEFQAPARFDRIVSVEMLEHVRNHGELLGRVARWLEPDGRFFAHVFSHREVAWSYEHEATSDWMARWFFTGGIMPSDDFLARVTTDLVEVNRWRYSGAHYERTLLAWLERLDEHRNDVLRIFGDAYGRREARAWLHRWRVFFLASALLWAHHDGRSVGVTHHLFTHPEVPVDFPPGSGASSSER